MDLILCIGVCYGVCINGGYRTLLAGDILLSISFMFFVYIGLLS